MKVIITSVIYGIRYISFNHRVSDFISTLVEELKNDYDWFLDITQYCGQIQGVLNTDDINVGIEVAKKINYKNTTNMVSVGEVKIDHNDTYTLNTGTNMSKGFIEPGRLLDKFVIEKKFGIYDFNNKKWITSYEYEK